jgi:hypothetical protein
MKKFLILSSILVVGVCACSVSDKVDKAKICAKDIVTYCPNVPKDNQIAQLLCLQEYKSRVSANCKKVME